jgi:5-methylcytosine-specific restriction endonuclease McrA
MKICIKCNFDGDEYMTWGNYEKYWHLDHIISQSKLPFSSMEDDNFKKCWALENLQPLEAIANIKKSNK